MWENYFQVPFSESCFLPPFTSLAQPRPCQDPHSSAKGSTVRSKLLSTILTLPQRPDTFHRGAIPAIRVSERNPFSWKHQDSSQSSVVLDVRTLGWPFATMREGRKEGMEEGKEEGREVERREGASYFIKRIKIHRKINLWHRRMKQRQTREFKSKTLKARAASFLQAAQLSTPIPVGLSYAPRPAFH